MKIGIIIGSIREGRKGEAVAQWVNEAAGERNDDGTTYELIDLKSFNVPLLTSATVPGSANKQYDDENVTAWSKAIDACNAFIFVTPEYNHGVPGGFKNAVDSLGPEWVGKPVAFVGHGSVSGVRAIEQWRQILVNFSMPIARAELNFNGFTHWPDGVFTPEARQRDETNAMLDQLEELTDRLG